ncbi:MAG: hypothetical protein ACRD8W_01185 [Nitrososphaeraceae archaeon]
MSHGKIILTCLPEHSTIATDGIGMLFFQAMVRAATLCKPSTTTPLHLTRVICSNYRALKKFAFVYLVCIDFVIEILLDTIRVLPYLIF